MSYTTLKTELLTNGILQITLSRPDKLNALNDTMLDELATIFHDAKNNNLVKALLITGEGKAFCAGADIHRLAEVDAIQGLQFAKQGQATFRLLETLGKPSIAAINGYAFGGGCELAMSATLRLASEKAQFGQPEIKLGVIPGYGGTQRLARLVGKGRALDLCITGRFIDAKTAYEWGLVTWLTSAEELMTKALEVAQMILQQAPIAVKAAIDVIDRGYDLPLEEALNLEALHFSVTCATQDKNEGTKAFLEKRTAKFKGA